MTVRNSCRPLARVSRARVADPGPYRSRPRGWRLRSGQVDSVLSVLSCKSCTAGLTDAPRTYNEQLTAIPSAACDEHAGTVRRDMQI